MDIPRLVAAHVVRFVAASQAAPALLVHGAWLLLFAAVTNAAGGDGEPVARAFLRLFRWLGGIGPDGHGDEGHIVQAMALMSLPVYVVAALRARVGGPRPPFWRSLFRWSAVSGAVALAGYVLALTRAGGLATAEVAGLSLLFATIAAGATGWAVAAERLGDLIASHLGENTPARADG